MCALTFVMGGRVVQEYRVSGLLYSKSGFYLLDIKLKQDTTNGGEVSRIGV